MTKFWRDQFINFNEFTRPGIKRTMTRNLVWHYTANPGASAANHYLYFSNLRGRYASAHIFIDSKEAICIIPLDEVAYHANQANPYSIGIELCIERDGSFHPNTIVQALSIGKELNRMYGLTISDQLRHFDVNGKICPKPWVDIPGSWQDFKQQLFVSKGGNEVTREEYEKLNNRLSQLEIGQKELFRVLNNGRVALNIPEAEQKVASWAQEGYEYVTTNEISDGLRPEDYVRRQEVWAMFERTNKKEEK